jgi:hypothetical protein
MIHKTKLAKFSKTTLTGICCVFLIACGGSGSNSGGPAAPPAPVFTLYSVGEYSGTTRFTFEGENIVDGSDEPSPFSPSVFGSVAGNQQIRIRYREFGGTSAIGPNGGFSVPSGTFPLPVRERSGRDVTLCKRDIIEW